MPGEDSHMKSAVGDGEGDRGYQGAIKVRLCENAFLEEGDQHFANVTCGWSPYHPSASMHGNLKMNDGDRPQPLRSFSH